MVQVEQAMDEADTILVSTRAREDARSRLGQETAERLPCRRSRASLSSGPRWTAVTCRMAVVAQSEEEALTVIERSASLPKPESSHPRH